MKSEQLPVDSDNSIHLPAVSEQGEMLHRIGHVTRSLHDNLVDSGLNDVLDQVASDLPGTRDRLQYIAQKTEEAAERVLNATDVAIPLQEAIVTEATSLEASWQAMLSEPSFDPAQKAQIQATLDFLALSKQNAIETKSQLTEIMMAQDFQDLTGQVIKKVTNLAQEIETQLVQVLLDFAPEQIKQNKPQEVGLMNGPQINKNADDIVSNQEQVDDLLDSLGF